MVNACGKLCLSDSDSPPSMPNIELRRNVWYATLHVPADARLAIGKGKLFKSLKTTDKRTAELRAAPLVAQWKARIADARGSSDPFIDHAMMWKREYETNPNPEVVSEFIEDEAKRLEEKHGQGTGVAFHAVATGRQQPLRPLYKEWIAQLTLAPKTVGQMQSDIAHLVGHFGTVEAITPTSVREWVKKLMQDKPASQGVAATKGYTPASIKRIISFANNFWRYLQENEIASIDSDPFKVPSFAKFSGKKLQAEAAKIAGTSGMPVKGGWAPFQPAEIVAILQAATSKNDNELADLIQLGMYTGARIEELCSLKVSECLNDALAITDSKTVAGIRYVPIHSHLLPIIERLKRESNNEYLLSGLTFNKYNDRSNAIGKRFGRLKKSLGFPKKKVFHSIRKTVITLLENAGISENLAADIVGHEKPRITYGLYSEGHSLSAMKEAIEKIIYPENYRPPSL